MAIGFRSDFFSHFLPADSYIFGDRQNSERFLLKAVSLSSNLLAKNQSFQSAVALHRRLAKREQSLYLRSSNGSCCLEIWEGLTLGVRIGFCSTNASNVTTQAKQKERRPLLMFSRRSSGLLQDAGEFADDIALLRSKDYMTFEINLGDLGTLLSLPVLASRASSVSASKGFGSQSE